MNLKAFEKGVSFVSTCWAGYKGNLSLNTNGMSADTCQQYILNCRSVCEGCRLRLDYYCDGVDLNGVAKVDALNKRAFDFLQSREAPCLEANKD